MTNNYNQHVSVIDKEVFSILTSDDDEIEIKKWNELFHTLKLEDCTVLRTRE